MKRAFTLIELMIVVSIFGIIAAITIPKYRDWRNDVARRNHKPIPYPQERAVRDQEVYNRYKLVNGNIVECKHEWAWMEGGAMTLSVCRDGNTYSAMTNVIKLVQ